MNQINTFIKTAEKILREKGLLNESGRVLYSQAKTLQQGKFYILGLNPGGKDNYKISTSLKDLPSQPNHYFAKWGSGKKSAGKHPLQLRLQWLMGKEGLGKNLENVCSSNLIFRQTRSASQLDLPSDADKCWPVHEEIIKLVNPKVLIVFGNSGKSPFTYLKKLGGDNHSISDEDSAPSRHGSWLCRSFTMELLGQRRTVIGLPHLSRYDIKGEKQRQIITWIKKKIK